jgi:tetratricopeptide (TPR) repeat protein
VLAACSPTRDRKINRAWHTLTGHYNVYFNGEQKLLEATQTLEAGHVNDFNKILDIFPYGDEAAAKGVSQKMDEVIKKSSKSIQDHTVGKYTDDSYLLMGKAHFFKQDYFAGIEAFQYVNNRYKDNGLKPIATTWIAKSYLGMKKPDEAEAIISSNIAEFGPKLSKGKVVKPPLKQRIFRPYPKEYDKELYATAADIAIRQKKYSTAAPLLERALSYTTIKSQKVRYTYILGQLYLQLDSMALANKYFTKVLGMNAPYDFEFNASINVARAYDPKDKAAVRKVKKSLKRMLNDEKNDGMYDQIHYEYGKLEYKLGNIPDATKQFKLSIAKSVKNANQKALSHLFLGNIYLELPNYKLAQAHYDSAVMSMSKDYKDYAYISTKKDLLNELIEHLVVIETEDSLQRISKLSKDEIEKKIDTWIAAEKMEAERKKREEALRKEQSKNEPPVGGALANQATNTGSSQWYFYNRTTVVNGQAEFYSMKKWGRRANEDFWRLSQKPKPQNDEIKQTPEGSIEAGDPSFTKIEDTNVDEKDTAATRLAKRKEWIKNVPFTQSELKKSNERIKDAYYETGMLYSEKLNDAKEAILAFETLIERFPGSSYEPEALFRLHKLYTQINDQGKAAYVKAQLIAKHPESPFAAMIQNKPVITVADESNKEITATYEKMYAKYNNGEYSEVISMHKQAIKDYPGNSMQSKFDMLHALAIGKTAPKHEFEKELNWLVSEYADTEVANFAKEILAAINRKDEPAKPQAKAKQNIEFTFEEDGKYYYVFATKEKQFDNNEALTVFNRYNDEFESIDNFRVNSVLSNDGYQIIYVIQMEGLNRAMKYLNDTELTGLISKQLKFTGQYCSFVITVAGFRKMLREQKIDSYQADFNEFRANWQASKTKN